MEGLKRFGAFVLILALLGAGAALLFWDTGEECVSILSGGPGRTEYVLTASDAEGNVYALGRRDGRWQLVTGSLSGERTALWSLPGELLPQDCVPALLYPAAGGAIYLGVYAVREEETRLELYRITEQGQAAELLLSELCTGAGLREQMASVRLSDLSEVDSVVTFAVLRGDTATFYQRVSATSGLVQLREVEQADLRAALALADSTLVLATGDSLQRTDRETIALTNGENIIQMTQAGTGIYYVDGASLTVFYADFADWQPYAFLRLEKDAYDLDDCTDLWMTRDGDALLLMDGQRLLLDRGSTVSDLSAMLYRPAAQCVLILAGLAVGVLAVTTALWYVVCEHRRFRLPLLVRWGVLIAAVAALGTAALIRWTVSPADRVAAEREAAVMMSGLTTQALQTYPMEDEALPEQLAESLIGTAGGLYTDTAVAVYQLDEEGIWSLAGDNSGQAALLRAELSPSFDRARAEQVMQDGVLFWSRDEGGHTRFVLYRAEGDRLLAVDVDGEALLAAVWAESRWMEQGLIALAVLFTAVALAVLCWISIGLRRGLEGLERLAAGEREVKVVQRGGDELASLADDVNALSAALRDVDRQQNELARSYRRFVPERVLSLLGKTSILEVDKQTFVSRHLAAMMLSFRFPPQVYAKSGRELFDNINEIIERTASIVTQKGGAVFNFAYDGYDAVFEGGSAVAVSTAVAVQQEILDLNREREAEGRPTVDVRIALDEGDVVLGVVGDENQIEPTSISSSFSIARHLVELCGRLDANILCTEAVINGAKGYSSRYMGKCMEGGQAIRTYEIFDGDPYDTRKMKEATGERFSEGVYALYSHDLARAKRIFLSLVHHNTGDGGARYYLYLTDRLEKQPEEEVSLD